MISMPASRMSTFCWPAAADHRARSAGVCSIDLGLEVDVGLAAAEELAEHPLEMLADGVERLLETLAGCSVLISSISSSSCFLESVRSAT